MFSTVSTMRVLTPAMGMAMPIPDGVNRMDRSVPL